MGTPDRVRWAEGYEAEVWAHRVRVSIQTAGLQPCSMRICRMVNGPWPFAADPGQSAVSGVFGKRGSFGTAPDHCSVKQEHQGMRPETIDMVRRRR